MKTPSEIIDEWLSANKPTQVATGAKAYGKINVDSWTTDPTKFKVSAKRGQFKKGRNK